MRNDMVCLPLSRLVADEQYQPRVNGLSREHLQLLSESDPADWPPLLVAPLDDGTYSIIDGFHRHADAMTRGLSELPCRIMEGAGYPEAFRANLAHGLPMSRRDRRQYAIWLHGEHPNWSLRQIARECGLSPETVRSALSGDVQTGQSEEASTQPENHVRKVVRSLVKAELNGEGRILGLFGNRRSQHVTEVLEEYADDDRARVAAVLAAWGRAYVAAAEPFLAG